ncbi:hypothetical protein Ciccas_012489 [Cichlidogyrus casuarinus]|uniref:Interleukin-6 n=1 Tax=Cichlidogyrus casuarinus TaxID=1844966 RepID=A0ABD2PN85_9PLAT
MKYAFISEDSCVHGSVQKQSPLATLLKLVAGAGGEEQRLLIAKLREFREWSVSVSHNNQ